jgi:SAM-dependent methyltransferase
MDAARRWAELLDSWAIPDRILASSAASPWDHDVATFEVAAQPDRMLLSAQVAAEIVPAGGSVLDVGCGGGRAAMAVVPPASHVIGVDNDPAMLSSFCSAATRLGATSQTCLGTWPAIAAETPVADVVVCHHVAYNVSDIEPFIAELTTHARVGVVLVLPVSHPMSCWNRAWKHFWDLDRPSGPTSDDFVEVLASFGLDPERWEMPRPEAARPAQSERARAADACRRLCLGRSRLDDVEQFLAANEPDWVRTHTVLRWPGNSPHQ